jgi:hypothetical protein
MVIVELVWENSELGYLEQEEAGRKLDGNLLLLRYNADLTVFDIHSLKSSARTS